MSLHPVNEYTGNRIGRITLAGQVSEFPLPVASSNPEGIVSGPDGNVYFSETNQNQIGQITPTGVITESPADVPNSRPQGITVGPDGNIWYVQENTSRIGVLGQLPAPQPSATHVSVSHYFPATPPGSGTPWQMISMPYDFDTPLSTLQLAAYSLDPVSGNYISTPNFPADAFHPGHAYWVLVTQPLTINGTGVSVTTTQPFSIPLHHGWNMVGDPFTVSVPVSKLTIRQVGSTLSASFSDAVVKRFVTPLYSYNIVTGQYDGVSTDTQLMIPWAGYWIYTEGENNLVVAPQYTSDASLPGIKIPACRAYDCTSFGRKNMAELRPGLYRSSASRLQPDRALLMHAVTARGAPTCTLVSIQLN